MFLFVLCVNVAILLLAAYVIKTCLSVFLFSNVALFLLANYSKGPFQYYIKYFIFIYIYCLNSLIVLPFFLLRPCNNKNLRDSARLWGLPSIPLGIKLQLKGKENIPHKAVVGVANHQSAIDLICYGRYLGEFDCSSPIALNRVEYLLGFCGLMCEVLFIDNNKGKEAMQVIREKIQKFKNPNTKLLLFPEGKRNNGSILPFKRGGFRIAIENQLPIMPMVVSPYYFINHEKKIFDSGKVIIQILPEIPTEGLTADDVDALIEKTRDLMMETFESLKKEVESEEFRRLKSTNSPFVWERIWKYINNEF